ncbi:type II toxin-antitoxin system VapC family toxin [Indioceanicola profundi]|uniref:type II toxin-antitoxin system VapC family toxin n=1 Tax=Indioceanicola profundi TaxID=2220096 RepID=UPI001968EAF7|nr:type II toxin-antitoxin system VapC family toxin [Indioceanicola profundi]
MDLLLDTHVLIWWDANSPQLGKAAREAIENPDSRVFVSALSPWEIAIKLRTGKLEIRHGLTELVERNGFLHLPILSRHGEAAGLLDWQHKDPFDRMLVAQAQIERLTLVHADTHIRGYGAVAQLWAR